MLGWTPCVIFQCWFIIVAFLADSPAIFAMNRPVRYENRAFGTQISCSYNNERLGDWRWGQVHASFLSSLGLINDLKPTQSMVRDR